MTTPAKPLTADEIARIKRYVSGHRGLATPLAAEEGQSLIATIEQQAEQIEKLLSRVNSTSADLRLLREYASLPAWYAKSRGAGGDGLRRLWELLDEWDERDKRAASYEYEALAATELVNDKR